MLESKCESNKKLPLLEVGSTEMEEKDNVFFSALRNKVSLSCITKGQRAHA